MHPIRLITLALGIALTATIVWAGTKANLFESGGMILDDPWGIVTMLDLYVGFVLFALFIWWVEEKPLTAMLWILPLPFLGNIWSALWIVVRWQAISGAFSAKTARF